jgi:hypothetical protein
MKKIQKQSESQEMESLIRKQLKDIMKGIKDERCLMIYTHSDTPMLYAILYAALENRQVMDTVTKQMLDIHWVTGPVI